MTVRFSPRAINCNAGRATAAIIATTRSAPIACAIRGVFENTATTTSRNVVRQAARAQGDD